MVTSKFLCYVLRHNPAAAGVQCDSAGWVSVADLIAGCKQRNKDISKQILDEIVETNNKKRFEYNQDKTRIRASQGHSIQIDLEYAELQPPNELFHGTATRFVNSIKQQGLNKRNRHHVHLSYQIDTAAQVGGRHGKPVILTIASGKMYQDGYKIFKSTNDVWLVDSVPQDYITFPE